MALLWTWSYAPMASIDNTVAALFASISERIAWPTQSVPALVDKANWYGAHVASTALPNCRAIVLATNLLKVVPVAIPRTPPSGFWRAVIVAAMNASVIASGTDALAKSSPALNNRWRTSASSKQTRSISFVHPLVPGEQPERADFKQDTNNDSSNWKGAAVWNSRTSRGISLI